MTTIRITSVRPGRSPTGSSRLRLCQRLVGILPGRQPRRVQGFRRIRPSGLDLGVCGVPVDPDVRRDDTAILRVLVCLLAGVRTAVACTPQSPMADQPRRHTGESRYPESERRPPRPLERYTQSPTNGTDQRRRLTRIDWVHDKKRQFRVLVTSERSGDG